MPDIADIFTQNNMTLIVSLPGNDPALAGAAVAGGADVLKAHIHLKHQASGTGFGSLEEERQALRSILEAVDVPVGLVIGAAETADETEMDEVESMGFAYIDAYAHHLPAWMAARSTLPRMVAVEERYMDLIPQLENLGMDMVEAAVVPHQEYGLPLNLYDLGIYRYICDLTDLPVIVPTQKAIRPDEVVMLRDAGVSALMIGAIVAGTTPESIEKAARDYRRLINEL
ncbi:MAG: hypothetical protein PHT33_02405 [bacterium]|nr:hypothetical protein [bacterium]